VGGTLGGARFELRLPALPGSAQAPTPGLAAGSRQSAPEPAVQPAGARCLDGLRLLVADDEDAVRATWARYFTKLGALVTVTADGVEARDQIRHHDFDAIVLDLKMPRLGGWEVVQAARQERPDLAGRIVVVSGDITGLLELGTAENLQPWRLLEKPAELDDIRAAVLRAAKQ
jgi:CheY-like chemotaxis protein